MAAALIIAPIALTIGSTSLVLSSVNTTAITNLTNRVELLEQEGVQGPSGVPGIPGNNGDSGLPGLPGATGPSGLPGATGPSGPSGIPGPGGGATGPTGVSGPPGSTGPSGIPGTIGATGPSGIGATGPSGIPGTDGVTGPSGVPGIDGVTGPSGIPGTIGATGPSGIPGTTGATGPIGPGFAPVSADVNMNSFSLLNLSTISSNGTSGISWGAGAVAGPAGSIVIGDRSTIVLDGTILGRDSIANAATVTLIGIANVANAAYVTLIGYNNSTNGAGIQGIALGYNNAIQASNGICIGTSSTSSAAFAHTFGSGITNFTANSLLIGNVSGGGVDFVNIRPATNNTCDLGAATTNVFKDVYANGSLIGATNSRTIDNIVSNSGSSTSGNLASLSGTTGKIITDSTIAATSVVVGPASAVTSRLASYNGTSGKLIQDSGITVVSNGLAMTGDLRVNTNAFVVDATNKRIGVGRTDPIYPIEAIGYIASTDGGSLANVKHCTMHYDIGGDLSDISSYDDGLADYKDLRLSCHNLGLNSVSAGLGIGVLCIANATSAPSTNPVGGGALYVASGALNYIGTSGLAKNLVNTLSLGGGTMTGAIAMGSNAITGVSSLGAASITMTGAIAMGSNAITGVSSLGAASITMTGAIAMGSNAITAASSIGASSITFSSTSGVIGTTTNNNAAAGSVGEFVTANASNAITTGALANITSISLTAGDWDVFGNVGVVPSSTMTVLIGGISTVSVTFPAVLSGAYISQVQTFPTGQAQYAFVGQTRLSLSGTTTVYMVLRADFASTATGGGYIAARRCR